MKSLAAIVGTVYICSVKKTKIMEKANLTKGGTLAIIIVIVEAVKEVINIITSDEEK
jgi:hypothetical protein